MREPAIGCSTVPVLDLRGNVHHIARMQLQRSFAPFLIVAPACHADKDLPATLCGMVDVPVVPAARLKGDVVNANLCGGQGCQIAFSAEILCKTVVGCTDGKHHFTLVLCLGILCSVLCPDFLGHAESRPRLGPTCIKRRMGQDLCNLSPGNTVVFRCRQVIPKRGVRQSLRHQCHHRHKAAVPEGEFILSAPHLPE